jgi:hypothetical protein
LFSFDIGRSIFPATAGLDVHLYKIIIAKILYSDFCLPSWIYFAKYYPANLGLFRVQGVLCAWGHREEKFPAALGIASW